MGLIQSKLNIEIADVLEPIIELSERARFVACVQFKANPDIDSKSILWKARNKYLNLDGSTKCYYTYINNSDYSKYFCYYIAENQVDTQVLSTISLDGSVSSKVIGNAGEYSVNLNDGSNAKKFLSMLDKLPFIISKLEVEVPSLPILFHSGVCLYKLVEVKCCDGKHCYIRANLK